MTASGNEKILEVNNLVKYFPVTGGIFSKVVGNVKAVDCVSLFVNKGEALGIVGESGCGKTTTGRTILRLLEPTSGEVYFEGKNIFTLTKDQLRKMRQDMQIIFQDPYASLNPRMNVGSLIGEPLKYHTSMSTAQIKNRAMEMLEIVGLTSYHYSRHPHEFSGGQRQRVGIARALVLDPKLVICDEPVSALDVSIQSQILNLLAKLQDEFNLTYIFISHDLSVVKHVCDRTAVMYLGKIVEIASSEELYKSPLHPYTLALLSAVPQPDPRRKSARIHLGGEIPSPINPPQGCRFHPRCAHAKEICSLEDPQLKDLGHNHFVACHFPCM